jgi:hypothetical protein
MIVKTATIQGLFDKTKSIARFSPCGTYRFYLSRTWDSRKPTRCFLMLNPSTADHVANDPTVERCQQRAMKDGFGKVVIVNLFALRATNPLCLYSHLDPIGKQNDEQILKAAKRADQVICAWGRHGHINNRGITVEAMLRQHAIKLSILKLNQDGSPGHPLYLPYDLQPVLWEKKLEEEKQVPRYTMSQT